MSLALLPAGAALAEPVVPARSAADASAPQGTLTVWAIGSEGPQAGVRVRIVVFLAGEAREYREAETGPGGFVRVDLPSQPFRGFTVDGAGWDPVLLAPDPTGAYVAVLRATPAPEMPMTARRRSRRLVPRHDPWRGTVEPRLGLHTSDALEGIPAANAQVVVGIGVLASAVRFGRFSLAIGGVADYAPSFDYESHTYAGAGAGLVMTLRGMAFALMLEGGQHTISGIGRLPDPSSSVGSTSSPVGGTRYVDLPYAGVSLSVWSRLAHLALGGSITVRGDLGRERSVVVGNRWVEEPCTPIGGYVYGWYDQPDTCVPFRTSGSYEEEEMAFTAGGFSLVWVLTVGFDV